MADLIKPWLKIKILPTKDTRIRGCLVLALRLFARLASAGRRVDGTGVKVAPCRAFLHSVFNCRARGVARAGCSAVDCLFEIGFVSSSVVSTHSVVDGADGEDSFRLFRVAVRKVQLIANIDAGNVVHLDSRVAILFFFASIDLALQQNLKNLKIHF